MQYIILLLHMHNMQKQKKAQYAKNMQNIYKRNIQKMVKNYFKKVLGNIGNKSDSQIAGSIENLG